jgi:hypothetical protein
MSTITAGTTSTTTLQVAGDTNGDLVIKTNNTGSGGTTAVTITTAGGVAFGTSGTAYGTSGQVLTSAGNAPPTWSAVSPITTPDVKTTGTSATWTIPAGITKVRITVVAGGGAGGAGNAANGGGGGGGGGTAIKTLTGLTPGNTLIYSVGAAASTSQVASGTETITTISATGGSAGGTTTGGTGGVGSNGDLNIGGGGGNAGCTDGDGVSGIPGAGGSSTLGGGGAASKATNGSAGRAYGGGGSGGVGSGGGGNAGVVIFEY